MDGHFCELAAISMQHDLQHAIVLAAHTGVREIARLMTIGRDLLTKAETVRVAAIEAGVPSLVEAPSRATGPFVHSGRRSAGSGASGIAGERPTGAGVVLVRWGAAPPALAPDRPPPAPIKGGGGRDLACCWFGGCIGRTDQAGNLDISGWRDRPRSGGRTGGYRFARAMRGAADGRADC